MLFNIFIFSVNLSNKHAVYMSNNDSLTRKCQQVIKCNSRNKNIHSSSTLLHNKHKIRIVVCQQ